ncbi:MAG: hypothetical protein RL172_385, partial [Bacteroidota bacterium]
SSYYLLYGSILGADNKLCNGESVVLVENVRLLQCNIVTSYGAAGFDFNGQRCQVANASSGMSMSNAIPSLTVTAAPSALTACFVSAPRAMSYTIKNNGAGPATNIVVNTGNYFGNAPRANTYGYIDTASLQIAVAGAAAAHPDPSVYSGITLITSTPTDNNLACNAGKVAHVQLTLPPTVILLPGDSLVVTYNIIYCASTNSCGEVYVGNSIGTQATYRNACGNTSYSTGNYVGVSGTPFNNPTFSSFESPAQVKAGECYEVVLATSTQPSSNAANRGYIEYELTMPAGVTFSSAALLGATASPHTGYPRVVGNRVYTRYSTGTGGNPVKFVFCSPIGLCTDFNLEAVITTSPDSSCAIANAANINSVKRCDNANISFVCTAPCAEGGIVPTYWKYNRKNYNRADADFNKLPDGTALVDASLALQDRYRPGDTLHSEFRSYVVAQTSPATINSWNYINANWNFSKHIWVPAGTATVTIKRGAVVTTVPGVPVAVTTYGKVFNADFSNAPAALTSLAPFLPNDSVVVEADFVMRDSLLSSSASNAHMTTIDDGTRGKVYADEADVVVLTNSVHASTMANPSAANQATCFVPAYNANVLHQFNFSLLYGNTLVGCTPVRHEIRSYTRKLGGYTGNYFPGEYRPEFIPDSLVLNFPKGMTVIAGSQAVSGIYINTPPTSTQVSAAAILPYINITTAALTGTTVVFDVKAALTANPTWLIQSEGTTITFGMDARGGCETANTFTIAGSQNATTYQWPSPANQANFSDSARAQVNSTYSNANKPTVNISSPNPTIAPGSDTACWTVLLQNSSGQAAPLNFIRITPNASFSDYTVKLGATTITANSDGLYTLGNINSAGTATLTICANTNSCVTDSFSVESGWACADYPTGATLSAYECWRPVWLKATPMQSQIQLTVDKQPSATLQLCATDTMMFRINSALANYSDNPVFRVFIPDGLVVSSGEIEYPDGSGNWEAITPSMIDGLMVYAVEDHSGVSDAGLPGTISHPATAERAARLRLIYTTTCDFASGSKVYVQQRADRPCGEPIPNSLGFNAIIRTNPITVDGVVPSGSANFTLGLLPASIDCAGVATISGTLVIGGSPTVASDTIVVTIPAGLSYAGNFVSSNGISVAPGYPQTGSGGSQILKLKLPEGVFDGTPLPYAFDVAPSAVNNGCGNVTVLTDLVRTQGPIVCNSIICSAGSRVILGSAENNVSIAKPDLLITDFEYVSGNFATGGTTTLTLTVANVGTVNAAAGSYVAEFFCGNNPVPFASGLFTPAIAAGASATAEITVTIPSGPTCSNGDIATVKIRPLTETSIAQCLCNETSRPMLSLIPVVLGDVTVRQQNCKTTINWHSLTEINLQQYIVQYSADGVSYSTAGSVSGKGSNSLYSFTHQPIPGRAYYRLKMTDNNGYFKYSDVISINATCNSKLVSVFPNPANNVINININGFNTKAEGKLYNSTGQLVLQRVLQNGRNILAADQLAAGTYIMIVTDGQGEKQTFKVNISH